jgi:hypothetical protein
MKTLKIEMAIAGAALFALGAFIATRPSGAAAAVVEPAGARQFSQADFEAFDRGFALDDAPCVVGIERHKLCFVPSPVETQLTPGSVIPAHIPLVPAEFRVIVDTDLKAPELRTLRYGQTLVLADPESRTIVDMMRLTAPTAAESRTPAAGIG